MNTPEFRSAPEFDLIKGAHIDIALIDPAHLKEYLNSNTGYKSLYYGTSEDLPKPLNNARLDYRHDEVIGEVDIFAEVSFNPENIDYNAEMTWQEVIERELTNRIIARKTDEEDASIYHLPHEQYGFCTVLDNEYVAHIQMTSEVKSCDIKVSLVRATDLEHTLDKQVCGTVEQQTEPYELFKQFSEIWSQTIDVVADSYGNNKKGKHKNRPSITISAPNITTFTRKEIEAAKPLNEVKPDKLTFDSLGGLQAPIEFLQHNAAPFVEPEYAQRYNIETSSFALYGPAGTGKSSLVEAFANEINGTLQRVPTNEIFEGFVGTSGRNLVQIFENAYKHKGPLVLFFDEFDVLADKRGKDSASHVEVKTLFRQHITETMNEHKNIVIAAATNLDKDDLDNALIRSGRLEPISVTLPNEYDRATIWAKVLIHDRNTFINRIDIDNLEVGVSEDGDVQADFFIPYDKDIDPEQLAAMTEGMTGADFKKILSNVRRDCYLSFKRTGQDALVSQARLIDRINRFYQN